MLHFIWVFKMRRNLLFITVYFGIIVSSRNIRLKEKTTTEEIYKNPA